MIRGVMPMSLVDILMENVGKKIDNYYMKPYVSGNFRLSLEVKPKFGELALCNAKVSKRIIEYLIETESLKPIHLMVLLDNSVTHLPCNENSPYSPFTVTALIVISRRCKNFQEVHFHSDLRTETATWKPKQIKSQIDSSLKNLSTSVTVLNFRDAYIDKMALKTICTSFKSLRVLNLHQALIEKDDFEILVCPECIIKDTVENLRIDKTSVSVVCTAKCLVLYTKLIYFRSDWTLTALFLERTKRNISLSFKTTVLEQNFKSYNSIISDGELVDKGRYIVQMFPEVDYAVFTFIERLATKFVDQIISVMNITKLELSCFEVKEHYEFSELMPAFENKNIPNNLRSLTLECFILVDIFCLSERCPNLEKLVLINNSYKMGGKNFWKPFSKLKELEIMFLSEMEHTTEILKNYYLDCDTFSVMISSNLLEKVIIVDQSKFEIALERSLYSGFLRKLSELYFFTCSVRIEILMKIFALGIPLKKLEYSNDFVYKGATTRILEYVSDNKYETLVSPKDSLPYWLRWSFVCISNMKKKDTEPKERPHNGYIRIQKTSKETVNAS